MRRYKISLGSDIIKQWNGLNYLVIVPKKPSQNSPLTNVFISNFLMEKRLLFSWKLSYESKYFQDKWFTLRHKWWIVSGKDLMRETEGNTAHTQKRQSGKRGKMDGRGEPQTTEDRLRWHLKLFYVLTLSKALVQNIMLRFLPKRKQLCAQMFSCSVIQAPTGEKWVNRALMVAD